MLATIVQPESKPWLTPNISFQILTDDEERLIYPEGVFNPGGNVSVPKATKYFTRVTGVSIKITNLKINLVDNTLTRMLEQIRFAVTSDLNPTGRTDPELLAGTEPIDKPIMICNIGGDFIGAEKVINIDIQIANLKSGSIESTFNRLKQYVSNAVTLDLNP